MFDEKAYQKQYRIDNKDKIAASKKAWSQRNRQVLAKKQTAYRRERREHFNDYTKQWKRNNPEKTALIERRSSLKRKYGISLEQYDELFLSQDSSCAICFNKEKLVVDHNHTTGEVRGLLCNDCNRNLIAQRDDPEIFLRAAEYIKREKVG